MMATEPEPLNLTSEKKAELLVRLPPWHPLRLRLEDEEKV